MVAFGDNLEIFGIYYPYLCLNVMLNNIHYSLNICNKMLEITPVFSKIFVYYINNTLLIQNPFPYC